MIIAEVQMKGEREDAIGDGGGNRTQAHKLLINQHITYKIAALISLKYPQIYTRNHWLLLDVIGS